MPVPEPVRHLPPGGVDGAEAVPRGQVLPGELGGADTVPGGLLLQRVVVRWSNLPVWPPLPQRHIAAAEVRRAILLP